MSDLQWRHSSSLEQWELVADGRVVGTIADEYLASIAAEDWEDRNVPEMVYPWFDAPAEPVMVTRFVPGLQSKIEQKFGLRLPDEARNSTERRLTALGGSDQRQRGDGLIPAGR